MELQHVQHYRPHLHFAPSKNWMNDPNGMVYFAGEYHLFFQHNPYDSIWGPMHWGHAVSKNLIEWEELEIALYPDELGTIFSGSCVVDWENTSGLFNNEPGLVAVFTHHKDGREGQSPKQSQSIAYSTDKGRTWIKYRNNPILTHETKIDFRDPKVFWNEQDARWVMVLATGQSVSFYSSPNLLDWQFKSEFGEGSGSHEGVWECPDLFKMDVEHAKEEKWVLLVSIGDNPRYEKGSRTQYFTGSFDGSRFVPDHTHIKWLDYGKDNYAGVSFSDIPKEDGRRIYIGWMSNWRYANHVPTGHWRSQMTIPRELSLHNINGEYRLRQQPVREFDDYVRKVTNIHKQRIEKNQAITYDINRPCFEAELTVSGTDPFTITLRHTDIQYTVMTFAEGVLQVDRSQSGNVSFSENFSHIQEVVTSCPDKLKLRMIVDSFSLELFINDGEQALTCLLYPDSVCASISISSDDAIVHDGYLSTP
ncbi:glycoside hydrolase family 32 protein [Alteribacillus sp. HJP-4]|uniref:glycoside hydrolase family 32 protein n=1 Tax=Alteribacillus sp. HJP-4 TaxID=2775394 RepID=UPI0035CD1CE9